MIAYHDAGHAVVGRVLDLVFGDVTIVPNFEDGSAGWAITDDVWDTVGRWMDKVAPMASSLLFALGSSPIWLELKPRSNGAAGVMAVTDDCRAPRRHDAFARIRSTDPCRMKAGS